MIVTVTPSGKAPPGRLRFGVGAMALVTAFPVAASSTTWVDTWARLVTMKADLTDPADGCRTTQTPEKRLT